MKSLILIISFLLSAFIFPQGHFQSFLDHIYSLPGSTQRQAAADSFFNFARTRGIPFIDNDTAVFLYRGTPSSVSVAGDFTDWNASANMEKIQPTNLFFYRKKFEMNARLDYKLVLSGSTWIIDPENPHQVSGGFGPNSELAMPEYIQPWEIKYNPAIQHGNLEPRSLYSIYTQKTYTINVYLPPGYSNSKTYPTVYFQDGAEYISLGSSTNVIDNLIDSNKINKVIAIFVSPTNRNVEYAGDLRNQYAQFFAQELVPFIDSLYSTIKTPAMRLVLGDSYGANISGLICYQYSEVFGNCGLHSAAFQPNNYEVMSLFLNNPMKTVKFSSIWGTYEPLWNPMRSFRDGMTAKGYSFQWLELPEGHSWGQWRASTDRILEYIFPYGITGVEDIKAVSPDSYTLENYPNPFNPVTTIRFSVPLTQDGSLRAKLVVYDLTGKEIRVLYDGFVASGFHVVQFDAKELPSGVYFCRLNVGSNSITKKLLLMK